MLKRHIAGCFLAFVGVLSAPLAWAEDLAVIVSNEFYDHYPRVRDAREISGLERAFQDAGFEVVTARNLKSGMSERTAADLWVRMAESEHLVVVLSGHFVRTGLTNWLLNTDAEQPSGFTVGAVGFPLTAVMEIAAQKQGSSIVAVAVDGTDVDRGPGTFEFAFSTDIPQGVTFIEGPQRAVADFIANQALVPGRILAEAARTAPRNLRIEGFLPYNQSFLPRGPRRDIAAGDRGLWQRTQAQNTLAAYENYLSRYPNGLFAAEAAARAEDLRLTPEDLARMAEDALNLSRDQRQAIQRNLSLLGYETGGIDGIFGRRTRQAIGSYQTQIGVIPTGYLNANQISRIAQNAAVRAAELAAEAERKRRENERRDRQFWQQTGAGSSEDGLRQYLQRYPDGLFADEARAGLAEIERALRRQARQAEREAWDRAVMAGTLEAYQAYLNDYPDGQFVDEARARVASLAEPETPPDIVEAAMREEESLRLSGLTRQLIEGQLNNLGLEPGPVDGQFDRHTRRALRRYERDNGLPVTGYVTRAVIVRLLASAVQQ